MGASSTVVTAAKALGIIVATISMANSAASDLFRNLLLFMISTLLNFRFSSGSFFAGEWKLFIFYYPDKLLTKSPGGVILYHSKI